jgi:hypothetical protein
MMTTFSIRVVNLVAPRALGKFCMLRNWFVNLPVGQL